MPYNLRHLFRSVLFLIFVISVAVMFADELASAQVMFTSDRTQFLAANPNLQFQDFLGTSIAPGNFLVCDPPENSASNDNCFIPGQILPGLEFIDHPGPSGGGILLGGQNVGGNNNPSNVMVTDSFDANLDIKFTQSVTIVGLTIGCLGKGSCSDDVTVRVFAVNGSTNETTIPVSSAFDSFIGIRSAGPIDEISLSDGESLDGKAVGLLNVWFGNVERNVPTLSEWGMISAAAGLGLIGVFFVVRRRKAVVNS